MIVTKRFRERGTEIENEVKKDRIRPVSQNLLIFACVGGRVSITDSGNNIAFRTGRGGRVVLHTA